MVQLPVLLLCTVQYYVDHAAKITAYVPFLSDNDTAPLQEK